MVRDGWTRRRRRETPALGLRARATVAWALLALLLSGGLATLAYQLTRDELVAEGTATPSSRAFLNARLLRRELDAADPDVSEVLGSLERNAGSAALVYVDGEWFSGSVGWGPEQLPTSLVDTVTGGQAGRQIFRDDEEPFLGVGVPIPSVGAQYFELVPFADVERTLDRLAQGLVLGAGLAVVAGAAAGWLASGRVLQPLGRFAAAAERFGRGRFETRLVGQGDRDLRALERAFNRMADAVQQRIDHEARFTSDVSHELRSPVASMMATISVARRHQDDPEAARRALDELDERVEELHRLVDDLLEMSRADAGIAQLHLEPVHPALLSGAVLERMGKGEVPLHVEDKVPETVTADKRRLGQMLQNLLENADRYAGGACRLALSAEDGVVRFAVEDAGPGVAEHERSYIFERFARGDASNRRGASAGSGLGLALVAEHAALHGGRVFVEDREGGGSRFVVELPRDQHR